eukprot:scaffold27112_cov101-Isochrysis_galbana.AAC.2
MDALDSALFNQVAPAPRRPSAGRRAASLPAGPARQSSADGAPMARPVHGSSSGDALRKGEGYGGYGLGARSALNVSPLGTGPPGRWPNPAGSRGCMLAPASAGSAPGLRGSSAAGPRGPMLGPSGGNPMPGSRGSVLGPAASPPGPSYSSQPFSSGRRPASRQLPFPSSIRVVTHTADARPLVSSSGEPGRRDSIQARDSPTPRRDSGYEASTSAQYQGGARRDSSHDTNSPSQGGPAAWRGVRPAGAPTREPGTEQPATTKLRPGGGRGVWHGYAADQNARHRNYMEDEHCVVRLDELREGAVWFGLFDGHGGRTACELAVSQLHKTFVNEAMAAGIDTRQQVGGPLRSLSKSRPRDANHSNPTLRRGARRSAAPV